MFGLIIAVILFNFIAFLTNKRLSKNQIVHIWVYTIAFQTLFDSFIDLKYHGYWYFTEEHDWASLPALTMLIPPVNIMFLNWYPFNSPIIKHIFYFICWTLVLLMYELLTLLPKPWGYFHWGWWHLGYAAMTDPILLITLVLYYKWICRIEKIN
nr:hypothetical protein [Scopulibacillus darangshiensis]